MMQIRRYETSVASAAAWRWKFCLNAARRASSMRPRTFAAGTARVHYHLAGYVIVY